MKDNIKNTPIVLEQKRAFIHNIKYILNFLENDILKKMKTSESFDNTRRKEFIDDLKNKSYRKTYLNLEHVVKSDCFYSYESSSLTGLFPRFASFYFNFPDFVEKPEDIFNDTEIYFDYGDKTISYTINTLKNIFSIYKDLLSFYKKFNLFHEPNKSPYEKAERLFKDIFLNDFEDVDIFYKDFLKNKDTLEKIASKRFSVVEKRSLLNKDMKAVKNSNKKNLSGNLYRILKLEKEMQNLKNQNKKLLKTNLEDLEKENISENLYQILNLEIEIQNLKNQNKKSLKTNLEDLQKEKISNQNLYDKDFETFILSNKNYSSYYYHMLSL